MPKDPARQRRLDIEAAIAQASERTKVAFPGLNCDLESALRWAADAPNVPFNILKRAFINYLETGSEDKDNIDDIIGELSQQLKRGNNASRQGELRLEPKSIRDHVAYLKLVKNHASTFKPGKTNAPKRVAAAVKKQMEDSWDQPEAFAPKSSLANLAVNFHPFWQKHAAAYKKLAQKKSSAKRISGVGGPTSRVRAVWYRRTDDYV